ncbi:DUF3159 domain-containing protein [Leucobacter massiliensis]|uniref:Potassium ABC transporter n=1 Tax=Leucobacter massiliensis TaxID=1686285 RepID=A0A2S9QRC9_9MICO|nr:DUF3159 domain-containing protein [Leucobacter massiliensis]PRI12146.1 hypothetical protein B4915_03570 [Leucobacter massiliensis]
MTERPELQSEAEPQDRSEAAPRAGLGRVVEAGLHGEGVSARGVLEAIGGWRGIAETLLPATVYLTIFVFTRDARVSAIAPLALALAAFGWRLFRREPMQAALSGLLGVAICVGVTLFTGRGEDYYLPGFWINGAWIAAHTISLLVGWPLIGLLLGFLRGSLTEWRRDPTLRRAARWCTLFWIAAFASRLIVQLPLYFAAQNGDAAATDALGLARLLMGVPLFALAAILTWLVLSRVSGGVDGRDDQASSSDDSGPGSVASTGDNTPST